MRRSKQFILSLLSVALVCAALALVSLSDSEAFLTFHKAFPEASLAKKLFQKTVCGLKNPEARFVTSKDGTEVCDRTTGNIWEQDPDTQSPENPFGRPAMTQANAISFCATLDKGYGQIYELPDVQKLQSVLDYTKIRPALTPDVFSNVRSATYLTATSTPDPFMVPWSVNITIGNSSPNDPTTALFVWCVRRDKDAHGF